MPRELAELVAKRAEEMPPAPPYALGSSLRTYLRQLSDARTPVPSAPTTIGRMIRGTRGAFVAAGENLVSRFVRKHTPVVPSVPAPLFGEGV